MLLKSLTFILAIISTISGQLHSMIIKTNQQERELPNSSLETDTIDSVEDDKRSWKDIQNSGWGKRAWKDLAASGWGKRGWQNLPSSGWGKRGWQNLQNSGWGKRGWNSLQSSGWGKRSWTEMQGPWGKRDVNELRSEEEGPVLSAEELENYVKQAVAKRAWDNFKGSWGKRAASAAKEDWASLKGAWGKRDPAWHNLKGLWGKRSPITEQGYVPNNHQQDFFTEEKVTNYGDLEDM